MSAGPVVVALDASPGAFTAVPIARELARMLETKTVLVVVGDAAIPPESLVERIGIAPELLDGAVVEQVTGEACPSILAKANELLPSVIVLCRGCMRYDAPRASSELGPLAAALATSAPCPVLLVNPERGLAPWRIEEILVPYDGTPSTAVALQPAAVLAERAASRLFVVYVAEAQHAAPEEKGSMTVPQYVDQPQHEWPAWAGEFLERLSSLTEFDVARLRLFVAHGHPGHEIVRLGRERGIDLIVIAWKGLRDHGDTAREILRAAPCPVLVLRTDAPPVDAPPWRRA